MRGFLIISLFVVTLFSACGDENKDQSNTTITSENADDAARNFIRLFLNGDLNKARNMLVTDSLNTQIFDAYERIYKNRTSEDKKGYKNSSIRIHSSRVISDSASVVSYSNSYKNVVDSLKVIKESGEWKVDLKYSLTPQ
jgi:mRNA deadenylase 3'-5' endonuclease subunit Ccr4